MHREASKWTLRRASYSETVDKALPSLVAGFEEMH